MALVIAFSSEGAGALAGGYDHDGQEVSLQQRRAGHIAHFVVLQRQWLGTTNTTDAENDPQLNRTKNPKERGR